MAHGLTADTARSILDLEPTALLEFFLIYYEWPDNQEDFIALHAGSNGVNSKIVWQNILYTPYNIQGTNWEIKGDQSSSRPHLTISNKNLLVSSLLQKYNNMNGCKVVRKRTFARFLDDINFPDNENPFGAADPNAGFADEKYYISHIISENKAQVEIELVSPLELENIKIPNRRIHAMFCPFIYRGYGCRYAGLPCASINDERYLSSQGGWVDVQNLLVLDGENYENTGIRDTSQVARGEYSKWYDLVNPTFNNGGFETAGGGGSDVFAYWTESTAGSSTVNRDTSVYFAGTASCRLDIDVSDNYAQILTATNSLQNGDTVRYFITGKATDPAVSFRAGGSSAGDSNVHSMTESWASYTGEKTIANGSTRFALIRNSAADESIWFDSVKIEIIKMNRTFDITGLYSGDIAAGFPSGVNGSGVKGGYAIDTKHGGILINPSGDLSYQTITYDDFTHTDQMSKFTVMTWFYPYSGNGSTLTNSQRWQTLFDIGDATGGFIVRMVSPATTDPHHLSAEFQWTDTTNEAIGFANTNVLVDYNAWNHAAMTFNKGKVKLYHNAVVVASGNLTGASQQIINKIPRSMGAHGIGMTFYDHAGVGGDIGAAAYNTEDHYSGMMDDIRIYNGAASAKDVEEVYQMRTLTSFSSVEMVDRGKYDSELTYNRGDYVFVEGKKYKMLSKDTKDGFVGIKIYYICTTNGTTTDPRNDSSSWLKDACGKRIQSCSLRFGEKGVLPFGGFPGTQKYPFQTSTDGY